MRNFESAPVNSPGHVKQLNQKQSNYNTSLDNVDQFKRAMFDVGIKPPDVIIADGSIHRFKIDGKLNGAYILHLDGRPAGYFEDFKQGIKQTWKASCYQPLTAIQRQYEAALRKQQEAQRLEAEKAKHSDSARRAKFIFNNAKPVLSHPYLLKKRIQSHGARLGRDNTLIIPIYNAKNELVNLQFISETGGKRFLAGGEKKGCFSLIGAHTDTILICEGFSTGCSLHEHTGYFTVVALDAGNLEPVAVELRKLYPKADIFICGDNDVSGVGQTAAIQAARASKGKYMIPELPGHDFNDVLSMEAGA
jgi:putative DNA primase/helicase